MGVDWQRGVQVGASTICVRRSPQGWWEIVRNGEPLVQLGDERSALARAGQLLAALQPEDRPTCPACGRAIGAIGGRFAPHKDVESKPGEARGRRCPGAGLKVGG